MPSEIYPYTFEKISSEDQNLVNKFYGIGNHVRVSGTRNCYSDRIKKYGPEIYNFEPRPDDIWLIGYPRSGTTLTQEILYLLGTNLNYEEAASKVMDERFPYLECVLTIPEHEEVYVNLYGNRNESSEEKVQFNPPHVSLAKSVNKRFIKSHMTISMLPPNLLDVGCKVIFIVRNVKDTLISNCYFPVARKQIPDADVLRDYWKLWRRGLCDMGDYFYTLKEAWARRNNKNFLFIFYEEMNSDKRAMVLKIADFLGKKLSDEELDKLLDHIDIKNFRNNKSLNNDHLVERGIYQKNETFSFIGKGGSGGWRGKIPNDVNKEMNEWISKNLGKIPDFQIPDFWRKAMDI